MPKRIQIQRTKGWRLPANTICVARPSILGNPFTHDDPAAAAEAYERLLRGGSQMFEMGPGKLQFARNAHKQSTHWNFSTTIKKLLPQLRGRDLACTCRLDQPCHADTLLRLANPTEENHDDHT